MLDFLRDESAGGLALIAAAVVALIWSNSDAAASYAALLGLRLGLSVGHDVLVMPLDVWVNDALMAVFFLTVALEMRREMSEGALASPRRAATPVIAAAGGMLVPAAIYFALNRGDAPALRGWAVPVATDIAFALAALSVLGRRAPVGLKVFLAALAIIDDLGAILIIALFYTSHLRAVALAESALVLLLLFGLNRAGVRALLPYMVGFVALWLLVLRSGLHPTLAGVALAFVVPAGSGRDGADGPAAVLERSLGAWVTWIVLPLFGLANAGLSVRGIVPGAYASTVVLGIVLGLVIGKQVGVFGATLAAVRLGLAQMPAGVSVRQLYGGALLCGIGFTMSLFIGDLAFRGTPFHAETKLAVFAGSIASALAGILVLATVPGRRARAREWH